MSDFWIRKIKTKFHYMDVNKDGAITKEDFDLMADRLCKSENADANRQESIRKMMTEVWKHYTKADGSGNDARLTETVLIESLKTQRDDPAFRDSLYRTYQELLDVFDTNLDGYLQPDEYQRFFEALGMKDAERFAKISFKAVDTNHDGKLSKDEIGVAGVEYTVSDDEKSPYKCFFGPLLY